MGKIISFSNQKGGVGKTTTCVNMAAYLSRAGKKVLLIDLDPQGNATTGLGFSKGSLKKSVYNVVIEGEEVKDNVLETELEGLYILLPTSILRARKSISSTKRTATAYSKPRSKR